MILNNSKSRPIVLFSNYVEDTHKMEQAILSKLRQDFTYHIENGKEYFEGSIVSILKTLHEEFDFDILAISKISM